MSTDQQFEELRLLWKVAKCFPRKQKKKARKELSKRMSAIHLSDEWVASFWCRALGI